MLPGKQKNYVLKQIRRPVTYLSGNLSKLEKKFINNQRELLMIVFAVTRLNHF